MNNISRYIFISLSIIGTGSGIFAWFAENGETIGELITAVSAALNVLAIIWFSLTKNKGEVKKLDAEGDSEIVDAAQANLQGAKLVTTMLKEQIDELRKELEIEKTARRIEAEDFRNRIHYIETELSDYRTYAGTLAKQLITAGLVPPQFRSSLDNVEGESDVKAKEKRKEDVKNVKSNK